MWRSILKGLEVLKEGIIWRIGDGTNVRIWEDPWIPRGVTRRPASHQGANLLSKVSELLDPGTGSWDSDLVTSCFHPDDAQTILRIPICDQTEDFVAWHFDSKGVFSVKSAYKIHVQMLKNEASRQQGHSSANVEQNSELFRALWKVHCPPRVHHFLWRFAHNSHPMYMNINRCGVELDTRCAVCGKYFEDGGHLFIKCKNVKQRWRALLLEDVRLRLLECNSAKECLSLIFSLPEDRMLLSVALLWCWWMERNRGNHGEKRLEVEAFRYMVNHHADEWKEFLVPKPASPVVQQRRWEKPPSHMVKINTDAAFSERSGTGGWGLICRDDALDILFAAAGGRHEFSDALHAEAFALCQAVSLADRLGVGRVIFETDSLVLKQATTSNAYDLAPLGVMFTDIRFKLRTLFIEAQVVYVPRSCNKPAHVLAVVGTCLADGEHREWFTSFPDDVISAVTGDQAVL